MAIPVTIHGLTGYCLKTKMLFSLAVIIISFLVGFAMKRGGLCTYAAVVQIVHEKRLERLMVFLGAAAWATLIVLPLYWLMPNKFSLSLTHHHTLTALLGGAVLGVGAFFNKGCFFGTFVQLVSGNLNYLATLLGLSTGVILTHQYLDNLIPGTLDTTTVFKPSSIAYLWLLSMSVFALFMLWGVKLRGNGIIKRMAGLCTLNWQSSFAMIIIGIGGGLLYATVNGWNYADVLANTTNQLIIHKGIGPSQIALISSLSMVSGGIIAALTAREFMIRQAQLSIIFSCFLGGLLMGSAAMLTPGGNDGLLLKGIPSLAPHALIGYIAMIVVMLTLVYLFRKKV